MSKFINFDAYNLYQAPVPEHTQESIESYLMRGLHPGGFLEAMLAGDLFKASAIADQANGPAMQAIANWIQFSAPHGSWGSHEWVQFWIENIGGCRTKYSDKIEKEFIVRTLMA